ncbi:MAG: hypothetical protein GEU80_05465 [Dehalococcoidia bacterium]|nr:hypothetical protein [Dehalococcoidia bacterium]
MSILPRGFLLDAFNRDCDVALVVSNDTDLLLPIKKARELGLTVGLCSPVYHRNRYPHRELVAATDFNVHLTRNRRKLLRESQFPRVLYDLHERPIAKPPEWA